MQKQILPSTIILALVISVATPLQVVNLVSANFLPAPAILIISPLPVKIYQNASVSLDVEVNVLTGDPDITYILYSLDGKANVTLTSLTKTDGVWFAPNKGGYVFRGLSTLDNLAEGKHTLNVYSHDANRGEMSDSREFTVDYDYVPPQPQDTEYINHTASPTPTVAQTETPIPTANIDNYSPLENPTLLIAIVLTSASLVVIVSVILSKKRNRRILNKSYCVMPMSS